MMRSISTTLQKEYYMSQFTITRLVNSRAIVAGTDINGVAGSLVIDTTQWDEIVAMDKHIQAHEEFDATVEEFFRTINEAAAKVTDTLEVPQDDISLLVLDEGTEGVESREAQVLHLDKGSVIMRLIEDNEDNRLVWVNGDLEVLAADTFGEDPVNAED